MYLSGGFNMNDPNHPIWDLLKYTILGILILLYSALMYKNGLDPKDILLPVIAILVDYLANKTKQRFTKPPE